MITAPARARAGTKTLGAFAAAVLAAALLGAGVPLVRDLLYTHRCATIGGQLQRRTEDVEPLAKGHVAYSCFGADGRLLAAW